MIILFTHLLYKFRRLSANLTYIDIRGGLCGGGGVGVCVDSEDRDKECQMCRVPMPFSPCSSAIKGLLCYDDHGHHVYR